MSEELDRNGVLLAFARTTAFVVANPEIQRRALQEILDSEVTDEEKVSQLLVLADDIEGQLDDANSDWPLLYEIISDDEDGSDSGPWASSVFGTRDLWLEPKFQEKVDNKDTWINGGFFVFNSKVLKYFKKTSDSLEQNILSKIVKDKKMSAYRHHNFWLPMDTLRDKNKLNELWKKDKAPWIKLK